MPSALVFIEIILVFGLVLAWGGWELWTLRRERIKDAAKAAEAERLAASPAPGAER